MTTYYTPLRVLKAIMPEAEFSKMLMSMTVGNPPYETKKEN